MHLTTHNLPSVLIPETWGGGRQQCRMENMAGLMFWGKRPGLPDTVCLKDQGSLTLFLKGPWVKSNALSHLISLWNGSISLCKVQNIAAGLVLRAPCHQNCTPLLQQLHWLPISEQIQNCLHVLQCNHRFRSLLSFWATTPLQSLLFIRHTHAQTPMIQRQNPWLSHFLTLWPPYLEQSPPRHQALSLPSKANSRHFSSQNISVKQHCTSPLSVCTVCVHVRTCMCVFICMYVHLLHSYA